MWRSAFLGAAIGILGLGPGCTPDGGDSPPSAKGVAEPSSPMASAVQGSWQLWVAKDVPAFQAFLGAVPGNAWQAYYQHQYLDAAESFEGPSGTPPSPAAAIGAARSHIALGALYEGGVEVAVSTSAAMAELLAENQARVAIVPADRYIQGVHLLLGDDPEGAAKSLALMEGVIKDPKADASLTALAQAYAAGALAKTGDAPGAKGRMKALSTPDSKAVGHALQSLFSSEDAGPVPGAQGLTIYGKRARLLGLVEGGELDEARSLAQGLVDRTPDLKITVKSAEGSAERTYYDPLGLLALSRLHARLALKALDGIEGGIAAFQGAQASNLLGEAWDSTKLSADAFPPEKDMKGWLPGLIFSEFPTPADLKAAASALAKAKTSKGGLFAAFSGELGAVSKEADQGQAVKATQDLARQVDGLYISSLKDSGAPEEGVSTVKSLNLPRAQVASLVQARAKALNLAGRPLSGLALLEYTFEKEQSSRITHINAPHLFLDTTKAYGQLGRHREALNYLYRLLEPFPELWPVYEAMSNLSVLGTLDQPGINAQ